jgi:hypothetical protein
MMICLFLRYVCTEKTIQITVVWDVTLCNLLAIYRHSFIYFSCPFCRYLTQMEFKRSQFVGVRFEVIIAVTNQLTALVRVRSCILVNT